MRATGLRAAKRSPHARTHAAEGDAVNNQRRQTLMDDAFFVFRLLVVELLALPRHAVPAGHNDTRLRHLGAYSSTGQVTLTEELRNFHRRHVSTWDSLPLLWLLASSHCFHHQQTTTQLASPAHPSFPLSHSQRVDPSFFSFIILEKLSS